MKKLANYLIATALMAFTFTSCEDVPSPFGEIVKPDSGDVVVVDPTGTGTESDPYNVAAVIEYVSGLGADVQSPNEVYIKGIVSEVQDVDVSGTYGNATYYISDDADGKANKFMIYRGFGLGGKKFNEGATAIKVGDNVVIKSKVVNYKGNTPETVSNNCIIVELNGTKDSGGGGTTPTSDLGTKDNPITVAKALETINKLADGGETGEAYVKGIISKVQSYNSQYKSITYYISDDGKEANELQVYSGKGLNGAEFASKDDLAAGDEVVIKGTLKKFVKNGTVTPEINQSSEIISLTKGSGGGGGGTPSGDAKGSGTLTDPYNAAGANKYIISLGADKESENDIYIKGKVVKYANKGEFENSGTYGNASFYISDDGKETSEQFYVFRTLYLGNVKWTSGTTPAVGDEVVICGKVIYYQGKTPETAGNKSYLYSLNGKTEDGGGGGTPSGKTGLEQSFESGKGDFTIEDKSIGEGITYVWAEDTKNKYMKASAYKNACIAAESWLISPAFSLKGVTAPVMTFNNACNKVNGGTITDHIKVMVYDGSSWKEATISNMPDGASWTWVDSTVDLKSVAGKENVKVAFKYVSTTSIAPTWEIKTVSIK